MFMLTVAAMAALPVAFYALFLVSAWKRGLFGALVAVLLVVGALFAYIVANQSPDFYVLFFASGFVVWAGLAGLAARGLIAWMRRGNPSRVTPGMVLVGGSFFFAAVWPVSRFLLPW